MNRLIPMFILIVGMTFSSVAMAKGPERAAKARGKQVTTRVSKTTTVRRTPTRRVTTTTTVKRAPARRAHTRRGKLKSRRHHAHIRPKHRAVRRPVITTHYDWVGGRRYLVTRKVTWRQGRKKTTVVRRRAPVRRAARLGVRRGVRTTHRI